ncbi:predicted protein [Meyerozyma guilliermondii ATCC 6260]|uniref:Temperature shock-inducible protein 1 n=1 Tax=Meyerozyma guilliermondii (strain ATCC 6260 / CBS 566 / DSM 6381 / JCM 1539 / NBRC 10279 / NRRL Y-324) TaxID=294746 RepID=A5DA07_PICGU|nr:uncharacterized protein PGUG_00112 [Meyerozyma guilliermondii ATCC 6260]EDK36014.2 predicted protein [Meyerozyma guilliermondii ATCC 6260]
MNSLLLFTIFATSVMADDLLSKLVSDVKANPQEYLSYIQTATASIPEDLTPLALQVRTYTDDSFTTLLDSSQKSEISAFATGLPWYSSRLLDDSNSAGSTETNGSTSSTASSVSVSASESTGNAGKLVVPGVGLAALAVVLL